MQHIKKLLGTLLFAIVLYCSAAAAQNSVTLAWNPVSDPTAGGYNLYFKQTTAASWITNFVSGAATTNVTLSSLVANAVYQFYITTVTTNGLESAQSQQVRYQYFIVNAGKATALTLGDLGTTNFVGFVLTQSPTNGTVTGTAPNVSFNPTAGFPTAGKDLFSYRNPDTFGQGNLNITNTYAVYKTGVLPPTGLNAVGQ